MTPKISIRAPQKKTWKMSAPPPLIVGLRPNQPDMSMKTFTQMKHNCSVNILTNEETGALRTSSPRTGESA